MYKEMDEMREEKDILCIFSRLAVENIHYALISLHYIIDVVEYDKTVFPNPLTYYFYHIQNVLNSCGKINSIFYGKTAPFKKKEYIGDYFVEKRSRLLRTFFKIYKQQFPLVFNREVRNTDVHIDERLHSFCGRVGDYNIIDDNTPDDIRNEILNTPHLRTFDQSKNIYYTYVWCKKSQAFLLKPVHLHLLRKELNDMKAIITSNETFRKEWLQAVPGISSEIRYDSISSCYTDSE